MTRAFIMFILLAVGGCSTVDPSAPLTAGPLPISLGNDGYGNSLIANNVAASVISAAPGGPR